ncbi:MAG: glycoside hydrolase [Planctomycetaceae bacterium]|nr:glycoside hydrolase [Planctomycetaceae bacterium]
MVAARRDRDNGLGVRAFMGVMRFQVSPPGFLAGWPEAEQAYISGFDGRVFPTRVERDGDELVCRRPNSDSGRLHVAWPVPGFGRTLVSTSSLREQETVYLLPLELARGKIGQLRNQQAAWEIAGMSVPAGFDEASRQAHQIFARATAAQDDPDEASRLSEAALVHAHNSAQMLTSAYVAQRLAVRCRRSAQFPASLGCALSDDVQPPWESLPAGLFNSVRLPICWRQIEPIEGEYEWDNVDRLIDWAEEQNLLVQGGPLLDFGATGLPEWLDVWSGDVANLQSFVCDFVETVLSRFVGRIRVWELASRVNTGGGLELSEEGRLALLARVVEVARGVNDIERLMVRIEQPWGGYQSAGRHLLSPLQFVDGLVRSAPELSAISLEITAGFGSTGPGRHDLIDLSRLLDIWSTLGLPLHVTIAAPSLGGTDSGGRFVWGCTGPEDSEPEDGGEHWTGARQAEWVGDVLPLLLAKQSVAGITWAQLDDTGLTDFPAAGLLNADGSPRPVVEAIRSHRYGYWPAD